MADITPEGIVQKSYEDYLLDVQDGWRAVFGDRIVFDDETPQGQITKLLALIAFDFEGEIVDVGRSLDINQAEGQQLDDLTALMSVTRRGAINSSVQATLSGAAGTLIPAGSQASLTTGEVFILQSAVQIESDGNIDGGFVSQNAGAIDIPANSLINISTPIAGWDSVDNLFQGITGRDTETDAEFTRRYYTELFSASQSLMESIVSAVRGLENVVNASGVENDTGNPIEVRGLVVPAHGFVVAVEAGSSESGAIGEAIRVSKSIGSNSMQLVECVFVGTIATVINAGYVGKILAADNVAGIDLEFELTDSVTLDGGGDGAGRFFCKTSSPVQFNVGVTLSDLPAGVTSITTRSPLILGTPITEYKYECEVVPVMSSDGSFIVQNIPINFVRVEEYSIQIGVNLGDISAIFPTDGHDQIADALVAYFNGSDVYTDRFELSGLEIAEDVYKSRLYTPINSVKGCQIDAIYLYAPDDVGMTTDLGDIVYVNMNKRATVKKEDIHFV